VDGWSHDWSDKPESPTFRLEWGRGDHLRVDLREKDIFGDDTIAQYELGGELSILLLSSPRLSEEGHALELGSDFEFGK
jgi:hypothetical protein